MDVPHLTARKEGKPADTECWYAMRVTYRRELKMQEALRQEGKETFVPMMTRFVKKGRAIQRITEPAIHNLLFVKSSEKFLQQYKLRHPELQYIISYDNGQKIKTVVPEKQMKDFMAVCRMQDETLEFASPTELQLQLGDQVLITKGPLAGMEGTFQRIQGHRNRRFIITIEGVISAITATVQPNQVQPIETVI